MVQLGQWKLESDRQLDFASKAMIISAQWFQATKSPVTGERNDSHRRSMTARTDPQPTNDITYQTVRIEE